MENALASSSLSQMLLSLSLHHYYPLQNKISNQTVHTPNFDWPCSQLEGIVKRMMKQKQTESDRKQAIEANTTQQKDTDSQSIIIIIIIIT